MVDRLQQKIQDHDPRAEPAKKGEAGKKGEGPDNINKPDADTAKAKEALALKEAKAQEKAQKAEQSQKEAQMRQDQGQTRSRQGQQRPGQLQSGYAKDAMPQKGSQLPRQFGHKIPLSRQLQPQKPLVPQKPLQPQKGSLLHRGNLLQKGLYRPLPQQPNPQTYRAVAQDRMFRGPLKDSPLHQKLLQKSIQKQAAQQRRGQDTSRTLDKGELLQMFRMRNRADQKDRLRSVLKYELAKAKQAQQKVQSLKFKTDAQKSQQTQLNKMDATKQQLAQNLKSKVTTSKFEQMLQKVLAGNKVVPSLPEGVRARFAAKTEGEWKAFFQNAMDQGSAQAKAQGKLANMIEALFRGLYNKGNQTMMVADFAFTTGGKVAENKFSQMPLVDNKLLEALKKLAPGEVLSQDLLKQLGQEFDFIQLAHLAQAMALTEEQQKQILKQLRQTHSPESQKRLELALMNQRNLNQNRDKKKEPFVWAGDQFDKKQRHPGKQRLFMYMLYGITAFAVAFIIFLLIRAVT